MARGDFDNDGFDDLAIGVSRESVGSLANAGAVNLLYGGAGGLDAFGNQIWHRDSPGVLQAAAAGDFFGAALAAGDFDGDGFDDLAIGAPEDDVEGIQDAGSVSVLYGSSSGLTATGDQFWHQDAGTGVQSPLEPFDQFGRVLAAGDFDNDGFDDLAIGVPLENAFSVNNAGAVNVLFGSAAGLTATNNEIWQQDSTGVIGVAADDDQFGSALAVGDFDNDGFDDLAIGVPNDNIGTASQAGSVNVLQGSAAGLTATGQNQWHQGRDGVVSNPGAGEHFGAELAAADFDGDGFDDLAVGVPNQGVAGVGNAGAVHVLYGSASGITAAGDRLFTRNTLGIEGDPTLNGHFGAVLAAGDFNDDGFADLAIGMPGDTVNGASGAGAVHVLYGSASGLTADDAQYWTQGPGVEGVPEAFDGFGAALTVGDYNGDGFEDLAIGVPREDVGSVVDAGAVNLLFGSAAGLTGAGDQIWTQDSPGVRGVANQGDTFGGTLA